MATEAMPLGPEKSDPSPVRADHTRQIQLTGGHVALVDEADYEQVARYRWCAKPDLHTVYAHRRVNCQGYRWGVLLHRFILAAQPGEQVDHINGDGLDNRRANLRICLAAENTANARKRRGSLHAYKGVQRNKLRWAARIRVGGRLIHLGSFRDIRDAATAYDAAAVCFFGKFARTNASLGLL